MYDGIAAQETERNKAYIQRDSEVSRQIAESSSMTLTLLFAF